MGGSLRTAMGGELRWSVHLPNDMSTVPEWVCGAPVMNWPMSPSTELTVSDAAADALQSLIGRIPLASPHIMPVMGGDRLWFTSLVGGFHKHRAASHVEGQGHESPSG